MSSLRAIAVATLTVVVVTSGMIAEARAGEPEAEAAAAVILDSLVIRVYDNAGVGAAERSRGISRADAILSRADVNVEWVECGARTHGRPSPVCDTPVTGTELVVRLLNAPVRKSTGPLRHALGYSLAQRLCRIAARRTGHATCSSSFSTSGAIVRDASFSRRHP